MAHVKKRLLVVDGYNVLNAWQGKAMRGRTAEEIGEVRDQLVTRLENYAGYSDQKVIVVFDAWQSDRTTRSVDKSGAVEIVFTQHGETADHYIERLCDEYSREVELDRLEIRVATSDALEQTVVLGRGAVRLSAREMLYEMENVRKAGDGSQIVRQSMRRNMIIDRLPQDVQRRLEEMRRAPEEPPKSAKPAQTPVGKKRKRRK